MSQDNASFTFLHRIEEVELNIEDGRWQSALALVLTLPDICGGIAFPEIVKRYRDGRAVLDRKQRPTRDVGNQYICWFDTWCMYKMDIFSSRRKCSTIFRRSNRYRTQRRHCLIFWTAATKSSLLISSRQWQSFVQLSLRISTSTTEDNFLT